MTTVWIPEWGVVMPGDNIYNFFPNIYPIRGSTLRDSQKWYKSLDKVRHLRAKHMIPGHMKPLSGEDIIFNEITHYRDAIQFVFDQTVRWMNKGLDVDEIVKKVRLPGSLANHPHLQQRYGKVSWTVRSIFSSFLGWFGGDPAYLNPLSKRQRAQRLANLVSEDFTAATSGAKRLLHSAKKTLEKSELHFNQTGDLLVEDVQWGLELAEDAMQASESSSDLHEEAKNVAATAMKMLAKQSVNYPERNYYLTYAAELESGLVISIPEDRKRVVIETSNVEDLMNRFRYRFKAESCDSTELLKLVFYFSDVNQSYAYIMRNCILEFVTDFKLIPKDFDAKITMTSTTWKDILTGKKSSIIAMATGDITIEGSILSFKKFTNLIDKN